MSFSVSNFYKSFGLAPRPGLNEITSHRCCECDNIRDDFSKYLVTDIPDSIMEHHQDSIPLLTRTAFRYYLPRYVEYTCDFPISNASELLLYSLSPNSPKSEFWIDRSREFSSTEREAIINYLEHRRTWLDAEFDTEEILTGINFWKIK